MLTYLAARSAEGIVKPIEVVQTKPVKGKASGQGGSGQPARAPGAMGKVVSESTARKDAEDRARFGESSRIITLEHMLGSVAELDDDLSAEIADECSQQCVLTRRPLLASSSMLTCACPLSGVVERVIVHERSPPPPRSEDAVVVFVVFSGPAGAWQALRALNDRFFSGRSVIAKYYPEARFARGERDL
jgi:splicing factor 45